YLANPDNPMGTWHSGETLVRALDDLPEGCLLVLDEAYIECAPAGTAPDIAPDDPRVIRLRTFSKVYGLAGARVGYAIGAPDLIDAFNKVRNHFGMNRPAQAGALAALADQAYLAQVRTQIAASRARIAEIAQATGLTPLPSATNFVAIDCGRDGAFAKAVLDGLIARGVFVRMPFAAPQNRCIRISCGTDRDLDILADILPDAVRDAQKG
ncbi:MAG: aminotransferase class I/II-fold pyridoxal phosphate-dependent enzyme, partial [Pseudomonadota bacterium]